MSATVTYTGNVGGDVTVSDTRSGGQWVRFNIAVYQGKTPDGTEKPPAWFTVKAFSSRGAENFPANIKASIATGMRVVVTGRHEVEKYTPLNKSTRQPLRDEEGTVVERIQNVIVADSVAIDLRYASVPDVVRNPRGDSAASYGAGRPVANDYSFDDEPF